MFCTFSVFFYFSVPLGGDRRGVGEGEGDRVESGRRNEPLLKF